MTVSSLDADKSPEPTFQKLDRNDDGQIDKAEFNARLVAMFNLMDSNSDGMLDDVEIFKK